MPEPAEAPQVKQLTEDQLDELLHWERRMILLILTATIGLLVTLGFTLVADLAPGLDRTLLILLGLIVLYSVRTQFHQKCPACGARLGFQTRLRLPATCGRCGVPLKANPGT